MEKQINIYKVIIAIVLVSAVGTAAYFYHKYSKVKTVTTASVENQQVIDAVAKLIELPTDEQPTLATVTDPAKLSGQAFFAHAKTGDRVIIYAGAKKAILYRPSENKLVEVAPLNLDDANAPNTSGTTTETK